MLKQKGAGLLTLSQRFFHFTAGIGVADIDNKTFEKILKVILEDFLNNLIEQIYIK